MTLERDLIVFSRMAIKLCRIEQRKISADHDFFSNTPLQGGRGQVNARSPPPRGIIIREPPLIVSARLREPKLVADLFLVPSYSPTHRL